MSVFVVPTWLVMVGAEAWRVPETELDAFLRVLTFNKRAFSVERESIDPRGAFQETS